MAKYKKVFTVFGITSVVVLTILGGLFFSTGIPSAAAELSEQKKVAKELHIELTPKQYLAQHEVPDDENASVTLKPFFEGMQTIKPSKSGTTFVREEVLQEYRTLEPFLPILEKAKLQKRIWFKSAGASPLAHNFPQFANFKRANKIFLRRAEAASLDQDLNLAKVCYDNALYFYANSDATSDILAELVQLAIFSEIAAQLKRDLERHQTSKDWITFLGGVVGQIDDSPNFRRSLLVSHMTTHQFIAEFRLHANMWGEIKRTVSNRVFTKEILAEVLLCHTKVGTDALESRCLKAENSLFSNLPKDEYDFQGVASALKKSERISDQGDFISHVGSNFGSGSADYAVALSRRSAARAVLLEAIAYLQGKNPTLSAPTLTGKRYLDTDGKPIRIKTDRPGEVWFYSVGGNQVDDGGMNDRNATPPKDDFVIKLKRR